MDASTIASGVIVAVIVAVLAAFFTPLGGMLRRASSKALNEHGVSLHVELDPAAMRLPDLSFPVGFFFSDASAVRDPPEELDRWWGWAHSQGGEDVAQSTCMLTLQADADVAVVVEAPRLLRERQARREGLIRHPEGVGGGGLSPRRFTFDLDQEDPVRALYSDPSGQDRPPIFRMSKGDSEQIQIVVTATRDVHLWLVDLPLIVQGRRITLRAQRRGAPFVTVGATGNPVMLWADEEWMSAAPFM